MGLFSVNYNKPGKGVDPNAPEKNAFIVFFELIGRKFFSYVLLNLMYFVIISPIVIYFYSILYGWLASVSTIESETVLSILLELFRVIVSVVPTFLHLPLLVLSLLLYGPFTAGLTYILRNFARQEHAWISDFFHKSLENLGQGILVGIIDILAAVILWTNFNYAGLTGADTTGATLFGVFLRYFTIVLFVFYFFMRNYIYQMIVTIRLPFLRIVKNAFLFAILGLGRNLIAGIGIALSVLVIMFLHPLLELLAVPLIGFSFCGFLAVFTTYPIVAKYVVKPAMEAEKVQEEQRIEESLGGRGGELPPELGGPGAGAHEVPKYKNTEQ